jgi:hypothetical protein
MFLVQDDRDFAGAVDSLEPCSKTGDASTNCGFSPRPVNERNPRQD